MLIKVLLPFFRHFYSTLNWTILKITEERRDILDKLSRPTHCTKNSIEHHQTFNALCIPISDKLRLDYATCSQISWIMRECNKGLLLRYKRIHGISLINVQRFIIFAFLIVIQGILNLAMFLIVLYFLYTWRKLLRFKFVTDIVSDARPHIYRNPLRGFVADWRILINIYSILVSMIYNLNQCTESEHKSILVYR